MIQVSKGRAFRQVQYLIEQSRQGNHVLFAPEEIRCVLMKSSNQPQSLANAVQEAMEVEPHLEKLLGLLSLDCKRAYLERLDRKTYEKVVKAYFNIVENSLLENGPTREDLH